MIVLELLLISILLSFNHIIVFGQRFKSKQLFASELVNEKSNFKQYAILSKMFKSDMSCAWPKAIKRKGKKSFCDLLCFIP